MGECRILVCDDAADFADFVAKVAELSGFVSRKVTEAADFEANLLEFNPTHILLDLRMPGMDGIKVIKRLAELQCAARLFICSGVDPRILEAAERLAIESGLDVAGRIPKPIRLAELGALFERLKQDDRTLTAPALRAALNNGQIDLLFHPFVALGSRAIVGFEGRPRWRHPLEGPLSAADFTPIAAKAGLTGALTERVVEQGIAALKDWTARGLPYLLALPIDGAETAFPDWLSALCIREQLPPDRFILEVPETAITGDPVAAIEVMTRLRLFGFQLSIDDFHTGYSLLYQLHRLPFSHFKIASPFVLDCDKSAQSESLARNIIQLAHNLGVSCIAEGVESAQVLAVLERLGCDHVQGSFIGAAREAAQVC